MCRTMYREYQEAREHDFRVENLIFSHLQNQDFRKGKEQDLCWQQQGQRGQAREDQREQQTVEVDEREEFGEFRAERAAEFTSGGVE